MTGTDPAVRLPRPAGHQGCAARVRRSPLHVVRLGRHPAPWGLLLHESPRRLPRRLYSGRKVVFKKLITVTAAVLTPVQSSISALACRRAEDSPELTTSLTNHNHNLSYY